MNGSMFDYIFLDIYSKLQLLKKLILTPSSGLMFDIIPSYHSTVPF